MKKILFLFLCSILFKANSIAQKKHGQALIDSYMLELPKLKEDSFKAKAYDKLSSIYKDINPDTGLVRGRQGLALAKKLSWQAGIAIGYNVIGHNFKYKSEYDSALAYYHNALSINSNLNEKAGIAANLSNIAGIYEAQGKYADALECSFKSLKINEEIGNNNNRAINLQIIGVIYSDDKNFEKALMYHKQALKLFEKLNNRLYVAMENDNIGTVYKNLHQLDSAIVYHHIALKTDSILGNKVCIVRDLQNLGITHNEKHDYTNALAYYKAALQVDEELGEKLQKSELYSCIGGLYMDIVEDTIRKTNPDPLLKISKTECARLSIQFMKKANEITKEVGSTGDLPYENETLAKAYFYLGDYKNSLISYKAFIANRDSLNKIENKLKITKLETQRVLELKDKQIALEKLAEIKKQNNRNFIIACIILVLSIPVVVYIVNLYTKRKLTQQKIEFDKLQAVANERIRIATDMHDDMGTSMTTMKLLSGILNMKTPTDNVLKPDTEKLVESANNLFENLREVIWTMDAKYDKLEDFIIYIRTFAVTFFDNTSIKFQFLSPDDVPDFLLNGEVRRNIFLCIKESLNNIVKHAKATEASISFSIKGNLLTIEIKDNGIGIKQDQTNKFGNGLGNMKVRLNKMGSKLEIDNNSGTKLIFSISI